MCPFLHAVLLNCDCQVCSDSAIDADVAAAAVVSVCHTEEAGILQLFNNCEKVEFNIWRPAGPVGSENGMK